MYTIVSICAKGPALTGTINSIFSFTLYKHNKLTEEDREVSSKCIMFHCLLQTPVISESETAKQSDDHNSGRPPAPHKGWFVMLDKLSLQISTHVLLADSKITVNRPDNLWPLVITCTQSHTSGIRKWLFYHHYFAWKQCIFLGAWRVQKAKH